jgi:hypothetical protein
MFSWPSQLGLSAHISCCYSTPPPLLLVLMLLMFSSLQYLNHTLSPWQRRTCQCGHQCS